MGGSVGCFVEVGVWEIFILTGSTNKHGIKFYYYFGLELLFIPWSDWNYYLPFWDSMDSMVLVRAGKTPLRPVDFGMKTAIGDVRFPVAMFDDWRVLFVWEEATNLLAFCSNSIT
jgi:hypothetical protein